VVLSTKTLKDPNQLPTPDGLRITAVTASSIGLAWNPVAGANNYRLHKNEGGIDLPDVVAGNVTSFTDSPLQQNTKYTYQVIAMNNQFSSLPSVSTSAITSIDLPVAVVDSHLASIRYVSNGDKNSIDQSDRYFLLFCYHSDSVGRRLQQHFDFVDDLRHRSHAEHSVRLSTFCGE